MKDWLIAHRGVQSAGNENTLDAFKVIKKYPIGWVELDIHTTKDGVVVCNHNFDIAGLDIDNNDFSVLKKAYPKLTTFEEAINVLNDVNVIVEVKPIGTSKNIVYILNNRPNWLVASFKVEVIEELLSLGIDKKRLYLLQHKTSFRHINKAVELGLGGIGINQRLLRPYFYYKATKNNLAIYTYTVNSLTQAKFIRKFFPKVMICTDRPDLLQNLK